MKDAVTIFVAIWVSFRRFNAHDGWAIASHIAFSSLMSFFPFIIFIAALASSFQAEEAAISITTLILETWPKEVSEPVGRELYKVLTVRRGDQLTFGALLSLYFSSNGVEALRIGLNRAYGVIETRPWWRTRLESLGYVIGSAIALIIFSFLIILGPLLWKIVLDTFPTFKDMSGAVLSIRLVISTFVIIIALIIGHIWLPNVADYNKHHDKEKRSFKNVLPGIFITLILWLVAGSMFGLYISNFARNYVSTYAGLASGMIVLVFLYLLAAIFIYGAELNATLMIMQKRGRSLKFLPSVGDYAEQDKRLH